MFQCYSLKSSHPSRLMQSPCLSFLSHRANSEGPSGLSQCTGFECPVSCIELGLVICFTNARRGSQGASRAAPGKSGLHARGEGKRIIALESREGTRASSRVEGLSRSFSDHCIKPRVPLTCACDLRELLRVPLSMYITTCETDDQCKFSAWNRALKAGALGQP